MGHVCRFRRSVTKASFHGGSRTRRLKKKDVPSSIARMRSCSFIFAFCLVALVCRTEPGIRILGVFLRDAACTSTGFCWTELSSDWQNRRYIYREDVANSSSAQAGGQAGWRASREKYVAVPGPFSLWLSSL